MGAWNQLGKSALFPQVILYKTRPRADKQNSSADSIVVIRL